MNSDARLTEKVRWSYGVMTVPERVADGTLARTLTSLALAGFNEPRLFIDGAGDAGVLKGYATNSVTMRHPRVGVAGNWELSMREMFHRDYKAERYVLFQDDLVCCKNLRAYLSACKFPADGYWNLYTFPSDHSLVAQEGYGVGWHPSRQNGRGALGLVFDTQALLALFSSDHLAARPLDALRGHKAIDGGVVESMRKAGRKEYVHNPSLLQHTGRISTMDKRNVPRDSQRPNVKLYEWVESTLADSFLGEDFDCLSLLPEKAVATT